MFKKISKLLLAEPDSFRGQSPSTWPRVVSSPSAVLRNRSLPHSALKEFKGSGIQTVSTHLKTKGVLLKAIKEKGNNRHKCLEAEDEWLHIK